MSALESNSNFLAQCDRLYSEREVVDAIESIAQKLNQDFTGTNPLLLCVMNGGLVFSGQLLPKLLFPLQLDYLHATRYRGVQGGGDVQWLSEPSTPLLGRTVIILDDILDEGITLFEVQKYCFDRGALAVKMVVMIEKKHDRNTLGVMADYVGLHVEDRYIFGMGMDYKDFWRNADGIYALKEGGD